MDSQSSTYSLDPRTTSSAQNQFWRPWLSSSNQNTLNISSTSFLNEIFTPPSQFRDSIDPPSEFNDSIDTDFFTPPPQILISPPKISRKKAKILDNCPFCDKELYTYREYDNHCDQCPFNPYLNELVDESANSYATQNVLTSNTDDVLESNNDALTANASERFNNSFDNCPFCDMELYTIREYDNHCDQCPFNPNLNELVDESVTTTGNSYATQNVLTSNTDDVLASNNDALAANASERINNPFACLICDKVFSSKQRLETHSKKCIACSSCGKRVDSPNSSKCNKCRFEDSYICPNIYCRKKCFSARVLENHLQSCRRNLCLTCRKMYCDEGDGHCIKCRENATYCSSCNKYKHNDVYRHQDSLCSPCFHKNIKNKNLFHIVCDEHFPIDCPGDIPTLFNDRIEDFRNTITTNLQNMGGSAKISVIARVHLTRASSTDEGDIETDIYLRSDTFEIHTDEDIPWTDILYNIMKKLADYCAGGSGWVYDKMIAFYLQIAEFHPIRGSTYAPLPKYIKDKRAVLNIQNSDQKCFLWSVLAHIHPVEQHSERVSNYYPYINELNTEGMSFPVSLEDIRLFQKLNPSISISVIGYDKNAKTGNNGNIERFSMLYKPPAKKPIHVNLFLLIDD